MGVSVCCVSGSLRREARTGNIYKNYRFLSRGFGGRVSPVHGYFGGYIVRNLFMLMVYHDREVGIPSAALGLPNGMDEREGWDQTYSGLGI